jgi:hypothetical protein
MKADVLESELVVTAAELRLPVGAQRQRRMATSNRVLPRVREFGSLL